MKLLIDISEDYYKKVRGIKVDNHAGAVNRAYKAIQDGKVISECDVLSEIVDVLRDYTDLSLTTMYEIADEIVRGLCEKVGRK